MTDSRTGREQRQPLGWRPIGTRHGWAKPGPDRTARAIVEETEAGFVAEVVEADDTQPLDEPNELPARWGPEVFESPADAIEAAEAHLVADEGDADAAG
jgi:hypothetical protein